jgi:hypothetical protein
MFIFLGIDRDNGMKCRANESLEHRDPLEHLSHKIDQLVIMLEEVIIV